MTPTEIRETYFGCKFARPSAAVIRGSEGCCGKCGGKLPEDCRFLTCLSCRQATKRERRETCSAGLVLQNGGLPPDYYANALTRIDQADVSRKCKRLARLSREFAFQALGPCAVFWDTDEDSITFEAMHHEGSFVVHGDSAPND